MNKDNKKELYQLKNIAFSYTIGSDKIEAVRDISLTIPSKSLITFSGPSGSGKSTLLNILGLIEPLQSGQVLFQNQDISKMTRSELNAIRKFKIGFIFQQFHLIPVFSAFENVAFFWAGKALPKMTSRTGRMTHWKLSGYGNTA